MVLDIYQVDAFIRNTSGQFSGNPAAVVPLSSWLDDELMQAVAAENNLAETAFYVNNNGCYDIRWFTPTTEVDLCGHATLAAAQVIRQRGDDRLDIPFHCGVGTLHVLANNEDNTLWLDFPQRIPAPVTDKAMLTALRSICGEAMVRAVAERDTIVELASEQDVINFTADLAAIAELNTFALVITARASAPYDFVSRFFAPAQGINEDPVTGSSFCSLAPFWAEKLGKRELTAWQASSRGGDISLALKPERVLIGGRCFSYMQGQIRLP